MEVIVCKDQDEGALLAHDWLKSRVRPGGQTRVFVPAGETPKSLYALWRKQMFEVLNHLFFVQVDDLATGPKAGLFRRFLEEELGPWQRQIEFIEAGDRGAELGILGLGLNGHVAFHEPGLPVGFLSGCVRLEEQTCKRLDTPLGSWGVTYGAGTFLDCRSLLILIFGESKYKIFKDFRLGQGDFPALELRNHEDLTVIADKKAYGLSP